MMLEGMVKLGADQIQWLRWIQQGGGTNPIRIAYPSDGHLRINGESGTSVLTLSGPKRTLLLCGTKYRQDGVSYRGLRVAGIRPKKTNRPSGS